MRVQLDRRHRVAEVMERNDHTIAHSTNYVMETKAISRSPVRHHIVETRPVLPPPLYERTPVAFERRPGPPHPYSTYTKSFGSSGPAMTAQTNDTKPAEEKKAGEWTLYSIWNDIWVLATWISLVISLYIILKFKSIHPNIWIITVTLEMKLIWFN